MKVGERVWVRVGKERMYEWGREGVSVGKEKVGRERLCEWGERACESVGRKGSESGERGCENGKRERVCESGEREGE